MNPVTPFSSTSGTEPFSNAMTGVPQAIASIITSPNGSRQAIGKQEAGGIAQKLLLLILANLADELDVGRATAAARSWS